LIGDKTGKINEIKSNKNKNEWLVLKHAVMHFFKINLQSFIQVSKAGKPTEKDSKLT
jgi:hypothetical protein